MANAAATHNSPVHLQRSIASALDVVGRPLPFEHALLTRNLSIQTVMRL
jgi:hypothetical protein